MFLRSLCTVGSELNQALRLKTALASRQNARWDGNRASLVLLGNLAWVQLTF